MSCVAGVSCWPTTEGTLTAGPALTTRFTAEFFATDASALGSVDITAPLVTVLDTTVLVVPTVRWSFSSVWVAWLTV